MGYADYYFSGRKRLKRMCKNITGVFADWEKEPKKIVCQNLQNHLRNVLEIIKYPQLDCQRIAAFVRYENIDYLDAALQNGKGVILLTAHFGAKQFLQATLGFQGYLINQIYFHMNAEELSYIQKRISQKQRMNIENHLPINFISAKSFMRPVYNSLKNNEILIIAGDGIGLKAHIDRSYKSFDFLGKKMLFPTNTAILAARTGASILPVFVIREKTRHRIVFEPPLNVVRDDPAVTVNAYVKLLEKYIRHYPSLWEFWEEFDEDNLLVIST